MFSECFLPFLKNTQRTARSVFNCWGQCACDFTASEALQNQAPRIASLDATLAKVTCRPDLLESYLFGSLSRAVTSGMPIIGPLTDCCLAHLSTRPYCNCFQWYCRQQMRSVLFSLPFIDHVATGLYLQWTINFKITSIFGQMWPDGIPLMACLFAQVWKRADQTTAFNCLTEYYTE